MLRHRMPPRTRPPATLGLRHPNQARTTRSVPSLTCAGIFNRRSARGESAESTSTSKQQPPATKAPATTSTSTPTLPAAPVRTPPALSRRQERELRAAVARREARAGPVIVEVRVEEGDTVESLARKTGLPAERIAAVAAEAAAASQSQGQDKGKGKGQDKGREEAAGDQQQQPLALVPGTALEFESPFLITPEVTAAVLELDRIAKSERLTRAMADRQRDELVASLREQDRAMMAAAQVASGRGGGVAGGGGRALGVALDVLLLLAGVSAAVVAAAASMGVVAALQKRSAERRAAAAEEEDGEEGDQRSSRRRRDWRQVVAEAGRATEEAAEDAGGRADDGEGDGDGGNDTRPAVPAWALGKAVWRVRMASGVAEAAVPLPPPIRRRKRSSSGPSSSSPPPPPPPPDLVWLAFEDEKDAEAWARWLTAPGGPLSEPPSPPSKSRSSASSASAPPANIPTASVVRAAPEQLHGAAKEAGRSLAFVPAGAFRPLPRPGEPQRLVLPRLARAAHPQRCGVDLLPAGAERRAAVEAARRVHGWRPTSGSVAAEVAEEFERTTAGLERAAREKEEREEREEREEEEEERERKKSDDAIDVEVEKEEETPEAAAATTTTPSSPPAPAPAPPPPAPRTLLPEIPNSVSMEDLDRLRAAARGETETQRRIRAGEPVAFADDEEDEEELAGAAVPASSSSPSSSEPPGTKEMKEEEEVVVDPLARALGSKASPEPTFDAVLVGHVGQRLWYRSCPDSATFAVPVMDVGRGERGLLELQGVLPAGFDAGFGFQQQEEVDGGDDDKDGNASFRPNVFVALEDPSDAERLAFVWHCSGLAASARAEVQGFTLMRAGELDAQASFRRAVPLVLKKGSLRLRPDTPADALLTALAAAATEQLVLSVPPPEVEGKEGEEES